MRCGVAGIDVMARCGVTGIDVLVLVCRGDVCMYLSPMLWCGVV